MKLEEFNNVVIGDELYIQGRTSHRGQRGKVIEKYNRVAIMKFSEDDIRPYHYNVLTTKPVDIYGKVMFGEMPLSPLLDKSRK